MCALKILTIFLLLSVLRVNTMAIKGSPLTRYDPCGLGVIHFDKVTEKFWQAVVNLGLYFNLKSNVTFEVEFEKKVEIHGATINSQVVARNDSYDFEFRISEPVPYRYVFFVNLGENETDVPYVKKFSLNGYVMCNDTIKASQTVESLNLTKDSKRYRHVCGRRSLDHTELTTVRTEAQAGDWPWHVAILVRIKNSTSDTRYECGGNIISRNAIVTAGHCVFEAGKLLDADRIVIMAGISNYSDETQPGRQIFYAEKIILHPNYSVKEATADLAVIKVNKMEFTEYIQPICIWGPVYDKTDLYGYQPTIVGFGTTEADKLTDVLRSTYTMVQNDSTCLNFDEVLYKPLLNEFTFCVGYGPDAGINPRNGDSGGGLVVPTIQNDHRISWFLRGVLSKCGVTIGQSLCNPRYYTVYTDVGPHYAWLLHHAGLQYTNHITL
ncbi:venom serine protease Bi-VSP-like [Pectinophora gossypiella]|uniref:venom serine protease Bi-VSP-like n=1 Tax=Pectinophora gossypiella TaxID=13191 RepID=UPI00214EBC64|nr:venom serine protease Bi-VSP-like [Pectinophora gossypiella]